MSTNTDSALIRFLRDDLAKSQRELTRNERQLAETRKAHFDMNVKIHLIHGRLADLKYDYKTETTPLGEDAEAALAGLKHQLRRFGVFRADIERVLARQGNVNKDIKWAIMEATEQLQKGSEEGMPDELAYRYGVHLEVDRLVNLIRDAVDRIPRPNGEN